MPLLLAVSALLLALYLLALARQRARARPWSHWRTAAFLLGMGCVLGSLVPPLASHAHHDLSAHMLQHLLLGMLGPIGLVLGTPVTLALRTLPPRASRALVRLLHSAPIRFITHPIAALLLNIGGMAALYLTPLYALMAEHAVLHVLVHLHFVAAGTLFSWAILQLEPAGPRRLSAAARLVILFVAIATHATLAKTMYAHGFPRGTAHALPEIQRAAQIMYYGGDLTELLLLIVLCATWPRRSAAAGRAAVPAAAQA